MLGFSALSGGRVEVRARAKINLGLEVLGRRADGYHELRSVMWAIELADRVTLEARGDGHRPRMRGARCPHDGGEPRMAGGRARAPRDGRGGRGPDPDREANPGGSGAGRGLRGRGSGPGWTRMSRGAAARPPAERPWRWRSEWTCPSFSGAARRWREGVARSFGPSGRARTCRSCSRIPGFPLATRDVYARIEPEDYSDGRQVDALVTALRRGARAVAAAVTNGLERAAARLWPGLAEVKAALMEAGCVAALMSGSGPTVFGIAPSHRAALRIRDALGGRQWRLWVARTVTGPVLTIRGGGRAQ